jgi:ethanolamine utilization protein EutQ
MFNLESSILFKVKSLKGGEGMKKLISVKDVEDWKKQGKKDVYIEKTTIITAAAKDAARVNGITISFEKPCCEEQASEPAKASDAEIESKMIYAAVKAMVEKRLREGLFDNTPELPYLVERDQGGLKLVRGNSVKFNELNTGNSNNKVFYQDVISKEDSTMSAGFLTIENSSFEWEFGYEEIDYVIEGTMTMTINGKTFTAYAGDVVCIPSGSKVVWGSPDKAKIFYTTYPANWADLVES